LYVVFTPFVAYLLLKEKISKKSIFPLLTATFGLYLMSGASLKLSKGDLLTLFCALSFAVQIVLVQKFQSYSYISLSFWQIFWNFVFCLLYSFLFEGLAIPKTPISWIGIIYTSIFATVIAFTLQLKYQGFTKPYKAALIYSAEPIFGHLSALILLGEVLSLKAYIGAFLIMLAIIRS
jgi:drug/metabolite transporter (DMT)-like permease